MSRGSRAAVWDDEQAVDMNGGDGGTTTWMSLMHRTVHLKMVTMVNFMLCVF